MCLKWMKSTLHLYISKICESKFSSETVEVKTLVEDFAYQY